MYGIFTSIWLICMVNVGTYTILIEYLGNRKHPKKRRPHVGMLEGSRHNMPLLPAFHLGLLQEHPPLTLVKDLMDLCSSKKVYPKQKTNMTMANPP